MPGDKAKLTRHISRQHKDVETEFLPYGYLPANSKYENFKEFLADSTVS